MKNFLQKGEIVTIVVAPEAVSSGEFIMLGALFGVAQTAADNGAEVPLLREGVFELPKDDAAAWAQGDVLYWDASGKKFTKTAAGNKPVGVAFAAALEADVVGQVSIESVQSDVGVNQIAGVGASYKVARGETALDASNPTPVATGLATVIAFTATLKGTAAPGVGTSVLTANIAGAAGNVDVYAWKPTSNSDPTLIPSTGTESFYWTAIGT